MEAEVFIKQQIMAGYKIHLHDSVWWQQIALYFCKPVLPLQLLAPGSARPDLFQSFLGYSHLVGAEGPAKKYWNVMSLNAEKIARFSIESLKSSKRSRVRKGLKHNEIKRIENLDAVIGAMKSICISTVRRTGHGKHPEYYEDHYAVWRAFMEQEFSLCGREWWGAFWKNVLVAYYYAYQVEDTMFISAAKSDSDYLEYCPNDALLFTFLESCRDHGDCRRVIFGDWSEGAPTLNEFKERFGFEKVAHPVYVRYNPVVKLYKRVAR